MTQLNQQWMLSSCTQRLLQIQQQLQQHNRRQFQQQRRHNMRNQLGEQISSKLSQQLVSSMVMKQQAHRQLAQQQNLLIHYLKQQLYQLSASNTHYQRLVSSIGVLDKKCSQLQQSKLEQQQSKQFMIQRVKREYKQLQQLLPVLTMQSTANYELVLRLRERNQVTRRLLEEKGVTKEGMERRYDQLKAINNSYKNQLAQIQSSINHTQSNKTQLSQTAITKSSQLQTNQQKLQQLQEEIRRYQLSNKKYRHVQEVAAEDNFKLKQQLMRKVEMVRKKEKVLEQLSKQREVGVIEKKQMSTNLQRLIAQSRMMKQKYNSLTQSTLQSLSTLQQIQTLHTQHTTQLTTIHTKLSKLSHLRSLALSQCYQKQEQLQKQFYFIQQYIKVNNQLIGQIEIVIEEGERKRWLGREYMMSGDSSVGMENGLLMDRLRSILVAARQQLSSIHSSYSTLLHQFQSYQIRPQ